MRYRHGQMCKSRERTVLETGPGFRLEWQENAELLTLTEVAW